MTRRMMGDSSGRVKRRLPLPMEALTLATPRALRRMTSSRRSAAAASACCSAESSASPSGCSSAFVPGKTSVPATVPVMPAAAARAAAEVSSVTVWRGARAETSPACMMMQPQSLSQATLTMSGLVKPVTSLMMEAPSFTAMRATSGWRVSMETIAPASARARITGITRLASSSGVTGVKPGRVDSPPTSMMSAPSSSSFMPQAMAASASQCSPPSEKESGVTLSTPIMRGRASESSCLPQRQIIWFSRSMGQPPPPNLLPRL